MTKIIVKMAEVFKKTLTNSIAATFGSTRCGFFLIPLLVLCLWTLPKARAVVPSPGGCYPSYTTAEGCNALQSLSTGSGNTGLGWNSLFSDSTGSFNTGAGAGTLVLNNGDSNTALGAAALLLNTTGTENTAVGEAAMVYNDTGDFNTAVGAAALFSNIDGGNNTAVGDETLFSNIGGGANTAVGYSALRDNTTGDNNTAMGVNALLFNTTGMGNTATGLQALVHNTEGDANTAAGVNALSSNTTGFGNTAYGFEALRSSMTADGNTAIGQRALQLATGGANVAVGGLALQNATGSSNIAIGSAAGVNIRDGNENIDINNFGDPTDHHTIRIGNVFHQRTFIGGIRGVTTGNMNAINVLIDSNGQLGTMSSSRRYKRDIQPMMQVSDVIHALKPVTFHYKSDNTDTPQFGLIAEEVAELNPDLVIFDADGRPYTVRYDAVNAMLLNEFLKADSKMEQQSREIQQQNVTINQLRKAMESVLLRLKEQDSKKIGDRLESGAVAPQVAANMP